MPLHAILQIIRLGRKLLTWVIINKSSIDFGKMKKLILVASTIAVSGISLISTSAKADSLYRIEGGGLYGGDAYQDSSGNYYNDDASGGPGLYGGGTIYDSDMNAYDCGVGAYATCIKRWIFLIKLPFIWGDINYILLVNIPMRKD